tara:strand:- start:239 stop:3559 length:3321 start_codon:yes stop_codon:yes gene_type:complete
MKIDSEILGAVPISFKNIKGGALAGLKLFKKIETFKKKEEALNKKRKRKLSKAKIMDKVILFLEKQSEYKNEADTYKVSGETRARVGISTQQALMLSDLQKTLGQRPTSNMAAKVQNARVVVRQRIKGIKDVGKVKSELRNFLRVALPKSVFSNSETMKLLRMIEGITPDYIKGPKMDNLFNEILSFVANKNNKFLLNEIENIFNDKYEKTERGRKYGKKVDNETRKKIAEIKKNLANPKSNPKDIEVLNNSLLDKFNELNKDPKPSDAVLNKMVALQIAIGYNNAMLLDNSATNKTQILDIVYNNLLSLIEEGRAILKSQLAEAAKKYRTEAAEMYYDLTGQKIDFEKADYKQTLDKLKKLRKSKRDKKAFENRYKEAFKNIFKGLEKGIIGTAESLSGLMDRISIAPGKMLGGNTQVLVTEKVNESSINYKKRMLAFDTMLQDKLQEFYGKKWASKSRENRTKKYTLNDSDGITLFLTQDQMYYLYNQYKDPASHLAFQNMYGKNYAKVMDEMEGLLKPEVKAFADWQVNEYFPSVYQYYNDVYNSIYRTDMPLNENYAGRIFREGVEADPLDILDSKSGFNTAAVNSASTLLRTNPSLKILPMNGTDALVSYTRDMEYFAAYGENLRDISKLLGNEYIKAAIKDIHGEGIYNYIDTIINKIAKKGINNSIGQKFINQMNTAFVFARIGLSPVITVKQLTSMFTYANDIGIRNWIKYSFKNMTELKTVWSEIKNNSVYMKDRASSSILKQIESYSNTDDASSWLPTGYVGRGKVYAENIIMYATKFGDRTAIMLGGMPNYSYYKDQAIKSGKTEEEAISIAIKKFEKDTKETQQSSDLQDKDYFQTGDAWMRAMNMFLTTPKQYFRKEISGARNLGRKLMAWDKNAGKGTVWENSRQLLMYHFFMPMLFQWVASGFPVSDWDDEDTEDMLRAGIIGNLNALFVIGELISQTADFIQDKPWYKDTTSFPVFSQATNMFVLYEKAVNTKDPIKKAKAEKDFLLEIFMTFGVPAKNLDKFGDNYSKIINGETKDFGEVILRILNYSEYQINGRPKKSAKKKPMTKTEMKMYFPDLYDAMEDLENPQIKQMEKEMRDLEKEMMESMFK